MLNFFLCVMKKGHTFKTRDYRGFTKEKVENFKNTFVIQTNMLTEEITKA